MKTPLKQLVMLLIASLSLLSGCQDRSAEIEMPGEYFTDITEQALRDANQLLGYIYLAGSSLYLDLQQEADQHLQQAASVNESLIQQLDDNTLSLSGQTYGRFTIGPPDQENRYYIPVINDVFFAFDDVADIARQGHAEDWPAGKPVLMRLTVSLDLLQVRRSLAAARAAIAAGDIEEAVNVLDTLADTAVTREEPVLDPVSQLYHFLLLAEQYSETDNYAATRRALRYAATSLENAGDALSEDEQAALAAEIETLRAELAEVDPSFGERAFQTLKQWVRVVRDKVTAE
ncbi:hypothetical protein FKG94_02990 [Exilibacterium tricleocarpae]|uniref:YfdX family protein n=1 Tax=Exilibacterium tricleocarpae TaxID=2591008 RepID=A0A545U6S0_9GAMM|nr:hypothetical protein [Exilibacterium tricleocarpae]TQV85170.1 hypothetical protein FKG94_02990 [Exilibacterium tricleocarpae]